MNRVSTPSPRSPWHSPVPYLFGGLAAMLGLIAFAPLILACSYWKFSSNLESDNNEDRDLEQGEGHGSNQKPKLPAQYEESTVLVIRARHEKPTCLATPVLSRIYSLESSCSGDEKPVRFEAECDEKKAKGSS